MTQKDECNSDRHFNMIMAEFIEATGRVADKLILPPLVDESEELNVKESLKDSIKRRSHQKYPNLHLSYKIETLIYLMAKSCLKKNDIEAMEKNVIKFYEEKRKAPKATKYDISNKNY